MTKKSDKLPDFMQIEYLKICMNMAGVPATHFEVLIFLKVQEKMEEVGEKFTLSDGTDIKFWAEENWKALDEAAKQYVLAEIERRKAVKSDDSGDK